MPEKRMLIVPAELVRKIDENRGDMPQAEFIEFLIDGQLKEKVKEPAEEKKYATKTEFRSFEEDIKKLLKSFLDFFVGYGLELGKPTPKGEFEELTAKLHELENDLASEGGKAEAKIKWKQQ
jgi:intein/homing endonuclease